MPLVTTKSILEDAYRNHYAIGAFAVHNLEIIKAVIQAAESLGSPVILQTTPSTIRYIGLNQVIAMVKSASQEAKIPVALHLDHGDSFQTICQCLHSGYTSVMIDASDQPFESNVNAVRKVVDVAHAIDVPVEAEIGTVGQAADGLQTDEAEAGLTRPEVAEDFVSQTEIDSLAPAFGTAHGVYQDEPVLHFDRLREISNRVNIPIVMHGASGVAEKSVQKAVQNGVSKVNISTELKMAFADELRRYLNDNPDDSDPRKYFVTARHKVEEIVKEKIESIQPVKEDTL